MDNSPQQRFCTTCGQPLTPGVAFCGACGSPVNAPPGGIAGQFPAGAQQGYPVPSMQAPAQAQDELLLTALAATAASQAGQNRQRQARKPGARLLGCGSLLLILAILVGPFIGFARTTGRLHAIFGYVAGGLVLFFFLLVLLAMLLTKGGRETLSEGCAEGCLDTIFGGLLGGG